MDRKAPKTRSAQLRPKPYARSNIIPQTPARESFREPQTPGSIFSKVVSMFTPSRWSSHQQSASTLEAADTKDDSAQLSSKFQNAITAPIANVTSDSPVLVDSQSSSSSRYLPHLFSPLRTAQQPATPTASKSLEPFTFTPRMGTSGNESSVKESPNQRLAEFFATKGDSSLSDMEMEGVMALLKQACTQQLGENATSDILTSSMAPIIHHSSPSSYSRYDELFPSRPHFATPQRSMVTPRAHTLNVKAPRYTPVYTPRSTRQPVPAKQHPPAWDSPLPSLSMPFKSRGLVSSTSSSRLIKAIESSEKVELKNLASPSVPSPPAPTPDAKVAASASNTPKRLSHTATTLLSLISPVGSAPEVATILEEDRERAIDPAMKAFLNPYAASPTSRSSPRRKNARQESVFGLKPSAKKKRRVIDDIEKSLPMEDRSSREASVAAFQSAVASATPTKEQTVPLKPAPMPVSAHPVSDTPTRSSSQASDLLVASAGGFNFQGTFKPSRPSTLRQSTVMSPPVSPSYDNKDAIKETRVANLSTFNVGSTAAKQPEPEKTSNPRPLFSIPRPFVEPTAREETKQAVASMTRNFSPEEQKALGGNEYKAYAPKYFLPKAGIVSGLDEAKTAALKARTSEYEKYSEAFVFPLPAK
ncbi:uncharacterized protein V1518DRAFT_408530 [Limtongia smithiae]|uniref:uncharacterized protein n=1 Tax=Limtongia smithiae TaxID=1125753 RepID=UPI0034CD9DD2